MGCFDVLRKAKGNISIRLVLVLIGLLPMIIAVTVITLVASNIVVSNLEENIKEELTVASRGLKEFYEAQINSAGGRFPAYDPAYIDSMKTAGVDLTLFKDNVRYITSITDKQGKRLENTKARH